MRFERKLFVGFIVLVLALFSFVIGMAFGPPDHTEVASAFTPSGVRPQGCTETVRLKVRPGEAVRCNQGTMVQVTRSYWLRNDYLNLVDVTCTCPPKN